MTIAITNLKATPDLRGINNDQDEMDKIQACGDIIRAFLLGFDIVWKRPGRELLQRINELPEEQKLAFVRRMETYAEICQFGNAHGIDSIMDHKLTWYALRRLGLRPPDSLFGLMKDGTAIEIYDHQGVQVYRNFAFCGFSAYTLEDLLVFPWHELFMRDDEVLKEMHAAAAYAFSGIRDPFETQIRPHICSEIRTVEPRRTKVEFGYISPLFDANGQTVAFLVISNLEAVE